MKETINKYVNRLCFIKASERDLGAVRSDTVTDFKWEEICEKRITLGCKERR